MEPGGTSANAITQRVLTNGVRFVLPRRRLGRFGCLAFVPIAFGLFFSGFAVFWMIGASSSMWNPNGHFQWPGLFFTLFGVPFVLVGFAPIGLGLSVLLGHCEIDIERTTLSARERLGPLRRTKKRRIDNLRRLNIASALQFGERQSSSLGLIRADFENQRLLILAPGYSMDLLHDLAERIRAQVESMRPGDVTGDTQRVLIHEASSIDDGSESPIEQRRHSKPAIRPETTDIQLDETDDGICLTVPPAGFFKGSKGLGCMAVFWILFMAVFTNLTVIKPMATKGMSGVDVIFLVFNLAFWAIGIGIFLGALNMGRRRAIIDVVGDTLLVTRQGLRGVRQHEWRREEIADIRLGPSNMSVNDKPINELKFVVLRGRNVGMFSSRTDREIEWMASILRERLQLDEKGDGMGQNDDDAVDSNP